jgi:hypothetical protein
MKFPKYSIRQWVSIGLYLLGLGMPIFSAYDRRGLFSLAPTFATYEWYHWLPFSSLFWLGAAYAWSSDRIWRFLAWVIFVLELYLSGVSWLQASLP